VAVIVPGITPVGIMTGMATGRRRAVITMGGMIVAVMFVSVVMLVCVRNGLVCTVLVVDVLICCRVHGLHRCFLFGRGKPGKNHIILVRTV
jgi:hypothetical protein